MLQRYVSMGLLSLVVAASGLATAQSISISPKGAHDVTVTPGDNGIVAIETTGSDPYLFTGPLPEGADLSQRHILSFEYFSLTGTGKIQVFVAPPTKEAASVRASGLSRSEGWSKHSIDLSPAVKEAGGPVKFLRIDFGRKAGNTAQIRNMQLRELNKAERALAVRKAELEAQEAKRDEALRSYLGGDNHSEITSVAVDDTHVTIEGFAAVDVDETSIDGRKWLVEMPPHSDVAVPEDFVDVLQLAPDQGRFRHQAARYATDGRDRLYSRWALISKVEEGVRFRARGRYADHVQARPGLSEFKPRNRKGLGGFSPGRPVEDIKDLDSSAVTINILLHGFLSTAPGDGRTPYDYGGRTWYAVDSAVARMDASIKLAADHEQVVSAILLVPQAGNAPESSIRRVIAHPDADPAGIYVMPNLTSAEGVAAYGAVLNFLAERYSRPDGEFGRIHHWIMHNEVNSGWVWTNMGEKSALRYMDAYHKSMRMMQLIAWQYDPHARVYISLEHHWNSVYNPHCYEGKDLLELLLEFSRAEGDFPWGIAHHPYPENLRDPRAWEDETAWFAFDTPRITFKNMEVIDAWVKRPESRYQGKYVRDLQFTEQAPNSPDYSEKSLTDQAACMAYLWKKMETLDSVTMFHVHNWVDNRHEGGLRIGLRRFPDDEEEPNGKKPVWYVFEALGTDKEAEAIAFAKDVIGVENWDEVVYRGEIGETRGTE